MPDESLPIAVFISGVGSNLQALIDYETSSTRIVVVVSDRPDASGLSRAKKAAIPTVVVDWHTFANRDAFTDAVCDVVDDFGARAIVLAGFMRVLGSAAIERFPNAMINVHPSLLPSFPGPNALARAMEAGMTHTGVTIHFVDEEVDHGPIILQRPVAILDHDDIDSLRTRIQSVEHRLLPEAVDEFAKGGFRVVNGDVRWSGAEIDEGMR